MDVFLSQNYQFDLTNYYFWVGLVNAAVALAAGLFVLFRNRRDPRHVAFFAFTFSIVLWGFSYAVWQSAANSETALFWSRALMVGGILTAPTLTCFFMLMVGWTRAMKKFMIVLAVLAAVFLAFDMTSLYVSHVEPSGGFPYWPKPGMAFHPFMAYWIFCMGLSIFLAYRGWRRSTGTGRRRRWLLLVGFAIAIVTGGSNFLLWYDIPIRPFLAMFVGAYVVLVAYAMIRYGLFPVNLRSAANTIVEAVPDALFVLEKGVIVRANPAAGRLTGVAKEELAGHGMQTFMPGFDRWASHRLSPLADGSAGDRAAPKILVTRDGQTVRVSVSLSAIPNTDGGLVVVCHDLRPLVLAFERLKRARRQASKQYQTLTTVIESLDNGLMLIGLDGRLQMLNQAAAAMVGQSQEECLHRPFTSFFVFKEADGQADADGFIWQSMIDNCRAAASPTAQLILSDGRHLAIRSVSFPVRVDGTVTGAVITLFGSARQE